MLAQDNKDIQHAYTLLEVISQDKIKRMAYEARQAELMDQRSRMISAKAEGEAIGVRKGEAIGVRKVATSLLARGMSVEEVAEITGLHTKQVDEMCRKIQADSETILP